jgi:hypothetical protein
MQESAIQANHPFLLNRKTVCETVKEIHCNKVTIYLYGFNAGKSLKKLLLPGLMFTAPAGLPAHPKHLQTHFFTHIPTFLLLFMDKNLFLY